MKKRFLNIILILMLLINIIPTVHAGGGGEHNSDSDLTVQAVHRYYEEGITEYPMVLTLTNNTDDAVTVSGDAYNQFKLSVQSHPMFPPEEFMSKLYGEAESIIVDPHETKEIAMIPSGGTDCWNAFYHPMLLTNMNILIKIDGEYRTFENISYGIMGVISNPLYVGEVVSTDNEDGTATLRFKLHAYQEEHEITCNGNNCMFESLDPIEIGPKTGLKKADFSVQRDGQLLGEIIQAKEVSAAEYELVWKYEAGTYDGAVLNTASGYGDLFVTKVPKNESGKLILDQRDERFSATITHTKEPIVIEHEDATLETAGATNIPKLVNLYFKEIDNDLSKEEKNLFEENVKKLDALKEIVHTYDISLQLAGEEIQPNGKVKITIPFDNFMKMYTDLKVVYITSTGEVVEVESEVTDKGISFITDHFSYYAVIGTSKELSPKTGLKSTNFIFLLSAVSLITTGTFLKRKIYL